MLFRYKTGPVPVHTQKLLGTVVGFRGPKMFCLHYLSMKTIDIPQSASLMRYAEAGDFEAAYKVACLGVTEDDWLALGIAALRALQLASCRACLQLRCRRCCSPSNPRCRGRLLRAACPRGRASAVRPLPHWCHPRRSSCRRRCSSPPRRCRRWPP